MKLPVITFCFIAMGFIIFLFGSIYHERVHSQIYEDYGINSDVKFAKTIPEKPCPNNECKLAHQINEIFTYNITPLILMVFVGFGFLLFLVETSLNKNKVEVEK